MKKEVQRAVDILKNGGIIIFPTDTAFGIGCRIDNHRSIEKLFKIRKRPPTQAMSALVSSEEMAEKYIQVSDEVRRKLIAPFWPGALTIVLQSRIDKVPKLVRGGGQTLGVRMPNHPDLLSIIKEVGVPILGPSANFHGEKTPFRFEDVDKDLIKLVDFVLGGECSVWQASTVIDCSIIPWRILRKGAVNIDL